ncbi:MAG TPA: NTP transferase domain-containing protein [Marmoricola sp.]|nr:NTP transferase domain-containing protein [Marmoricola sp.]
MGAVVVAGGGAARMGGVDKGSIEVGGRTLLEHVLAALPHVADVVVVGDEVGTSRPVTFTREDPPGGGPAAALLAGLRAFPHAPGRVLVLAGDLPRVTEETLERLEAAVGDDVDGAVLVDRGGRAQYLCASYRVAALLASAPPSGEEYGLPMHRLLAPLRLAEVAAVGDEALDVDTWEDLRAVREGDDFGA